MHIHNWLQRELKGWPQVVFPLTVLFCFLMYSSAYLSFADAMGWKFHNSSLFNKSSYFSEYTLVFLLCTSIVEEFSYRLAPLLIAARLNRSWALYGTILLASTMFGYIHGGWLNVGYQGVAGIALSIIYLKSGGMDGKVLKPYLVCIAAHTAYNLFTSYVVSSS